jgi:hypothetical protein
MEDAGDSLGRTGEEDRAPQAKTSEARGEAPELDRLEKTAANATPAASVTADAELLQTEGAATAGVVASRPATNEVTAGGTPAAGASSGPAGLGDLREVMARC